MRQERIELSGYKGMWLFAMFDLPVDDKEARKRYTQFRAVLLKDGFMMFQYSVYGRYCADEESAEVHRKRVRKSLPPEGHIRLLAVTDHQFSKMETYYGKKRAPTEAPPEQMMLI